MHRFYDTELETFRSQLILMGEKTIEQVWLALRTLTDHATNIAEEMVYLSQARDIRHAPENKKTPAV